MNTSREYGQEYGLDEEELCEVKFAFISSMGMKILFGFLINFFDYFLLGATNSRQEDGVERK